MKYRTYSKLLFLAFIIGGLLVPLRAQSLPFLQIAVDSRSAAMGEVQLASPGQAMTIFTNPAGLASVSGLQLATTATNWLLDLRQYGGVAAVPIAGVGTVGLSTVWMDYGTFDRTIPSAGTPDGYRTTGTFSVAEYAVGLAYARPVTPQWFVGGQVKVVGQRLPAGGLESGSAGRTVLLGDVGTIYTPGWHDLRVGLAATNLARTPGIPDAAPGALRTDLGVALDLLSLVTATPAHHLTAAVDWIQDPKTTPVQHLGAEYGFRQLVFLRGGYRLGADLSGLTAGVGVAVPLPGLHLRADYAYTEFGKYFGAVHRFTIGVQME